MWLVIGVQFPWLWLLGDESLLTSGTSNGPGELTRVSTERNENDNNFTSNFLKPFCWWLVFFCCFNETPNTTAHYLVMELTLITAELFSPIIKEMLTPTPFITAAIAVAVVRCSAGNQVADNNGAPPIATGPPTMTPNEKTRNHQHCKSLDCTYRRCLQRYGLCNVSSAVQVVSPLRCASTHTDIHKFNQ